MGNVYMEADQVRFKSSTYRNVQEGLAAALEGGGGGGTTVVANPEGSATAGLNKLQVGETIYGIPAEAGDISYDNTTSGLTADDVQEAIDEVAGDIGGIQDLIPSGATSSNKLATASDIPDAVTGNPTGSATAGDLTKLQIGDDIYNVPGGSLTPVDVSSLLDLTANNTGLTVSIQQALKYGDMVFAVFSLSAPSQSVDLTGKVIMGLDSSLSPSASFRQAATASSGHDCLLYIDGSLNQIRFTLDNTNTSIDGSVYGQFIWFI